MEIGGGCEFSPNALIYEQDHDVKWESGLTWRWEILCPNHKIGKGCRIGAGTIILKGVRALELVAMR